MLQETVLTLQFIEILLDIFHSKQWKHIGKRGLGTCWESLDKTSIKSTKMTTVISIIESSISS